MLINKAHLIASEAVVEEEVSESVVEVGTKSDVAVSFVRVGELPGEMMVARKVLRRSVGVKAHCDDSG